MKKSKIISLLLAGALLVGGTFIGTKALFSDTETVANQLVLTTGKVDIRIIPDRWIRNVEDKNEDGVINALDDVYGQGCEESVEGIFTNVQPGETFTRYINVIAQDNTYDVNIDVVLKEFSKDNEKIKEFIKINGDSLANITQNAPIKANTNTGGFITISIDDTDEAWEAFNGAGTINLNALYEIKATQAE